MYVRGKGDYCSAGSSLSTLDDVIMLGVFDRWMEML